MVIEARHINKTFGAFAALRDVSLQVNDGELVALLGPSGSGKTTLLRILAGLDRPDPNPESAVLFEGQDVTHLDASDRRVGFVFQHYALFRNMTVFENIAFGLRVRPRPLRLAKDEIRDRVAALLDLIHLESLANRYPSQLSGGQRQRVALARALAIEPKVLLLDEPFGALDAKVRQGLRRWLRRLHDEVHVTSLLVTHDQDEALEVADRVVVTNLGRIEQVGTPEQVFRNPASEFVMDFLADVNLFRGRIEPAPPDRLVPHPAGRPSLRARVLRVQSAGPQVKLELEAETGEALTVEMPHAEFRQTGIQPDDRVFVGLPEARIFREDYSI